MKNNNCVILKSTILDDISLLDLYYYLNLIIKESSNKNNNALQDIIFLRNIIEKELDL